MTLRRTRRKLLLTCALAISSSPAGPPAAQALPTSGGPATVTAIMSGSGQTPADFSVYEASLVEIQEALDEGRVTSVELVDRYLARIRAYDRSGPMLNAILRFNPEARNQAAALDAERESGRVRGSMHGIPVVLKDNYDVEGMRTTGGSVALAALRPSDDAFQVRKLREAGAVILAKTNLHELASGITTISSLGGQTRNPYDPFRNPGGSSGGTSAAIAASFAAVGWGSDTCGSIRIPSALNNLFGLRPTKGISSIDGILPMSHTQDTGGPLARTVMDLAIALDATVGHDPADPATSRVEGSPVASFVDALEGATLEGVRIGSLEPWLQGGEVSGVVRAALERMDEAGAEVVPVELSDMDELLNGSSVIRHELKFDLADYLASIPNAPVDSLGEIIDAGAYHERLDGVFRLWNSAEDPDSPEYREALEKQGRLRSAIQTLLIEEDLDAIAYPTIADEAAWIEGQASGSRCQLSAHSGLPAISIPAGFTEQEIPVGLELLGRSLDDQRLVSIAYAYERSFSPRRPPYRTPELREGAAPQPVLVNVAWAMGEHEIRARFAVDQPGGVMGYWVSLPETPPDQVHAVTLERRGGEGPEAVVQRVLGPGIAMAEGSFRMTPALYQDLVEGNILVALYTESAPLGAVRLPLSAQDALGRRPGASAQPGPG